MIRMSVKCKHLKQFHSRENSRFNYTSVIRPLFYFFSSPHSFGRWLRHTSLSHSFDGARCESRAARINSEMEFTFSKAEQKEKKSMRRRRSQFHSRCYAFKIFPEAIHTLIDASGPDSRLTLFAESIDVLFNKIWCFQFAPSCQNYNCDVLHTCTHMNCPITGARQNRKIQICTPTTTPSPTTKHLRVTVCRLLAAAASGRCAL